MDVYNLPLSETGEPIPAGTGQFIKLPKPGSKPYTLRFVIFSTSEIVNRGELYCNVPPEGVKFDRFKYYSYPIKAEFNKETFIDVQINCPGAFSYYIKYAPLTDPYFGSDIDLEFEDLSLSPAEKPKSKYLSVIQSEDTSDVQSLQEEKSSVALHELDDYARSCTPKYYFIVSAGFTMNGKPLSLNSLNIESVISKWMGPVDTWKEKLDLIKDKGYNMIHFTPLQQRGSSNSPYSIYDQLAFDKECFPNGEKDVSALVQTMEHEQGLLSLTDVVYNHTAHNSEWLRDHPEAGYSVKTAPHLNPALELDTALLDFSAKLTELGFPTSLNNVDDLNRIMDGIKKHVIEPLKLWEYYVINVKEISDEVSAKWKSHVSSSGFQTFEVADEFKTSLKNLAIFAVENASVDFDKFGHARNIRNVDEKIFIEILAAILPDGTNSSQEQVSEKAIAILNEINLPLYRDYDKDIGEILMQLFNRIKYTRVDDHGPKFGDITKENPLIETYFTRIKTRKTGEEIALANNGWIWNGNPLVDFASSRSRAYLRREVIVWGDCVKLRYGSHPKDSPYLWERMTKYTELMAKYFHGFRIDNCHSTPLHVGEYMLDKARLVRNNLYVVAELFTGSEDMDKIFVERLGITSLIREAMQAWSVEELSRLVHRHGGRAIGSFSKQPIEEFAKTFDANQKHHIASSSNIHALFMDCTHDNETPTQKRTVEDTLPNAALVSMCACAIGSVMGYDELNPKLLEIVTETRQYTFGDGIGKIKKVLYDVHTEMGQDNAEEMHVHHEGQYITVHRVNSRTGKGWFLIARTKFGQEGDQHLNDITIEGTKAECVLSVALEKTGEYQEDAKLINSVPANVVELEHPGINWDASSNTSTISVNGFFPQGSIALIKTSIQAIDNDLDNFVRSGADEAVSKMNELDLNVAMYRCDGEERDASNGQDGVYNIPNYGTLVYAGVVGWMGPLSDMINDNNLAHAICDHLRQGHWALDYSVNRLYKYEETHPGIKPYTEWLKSRFDAIRGLPSFMIPRYFGLIQLNAYKACRSKALSLMPSSIGQGTLFLQRIALTSIQMVGRVPSTSIFPFDNVGSMAAGLPHFSHDYMRCWGRDVFLSLRGLLLSTGRHEEAKQHILGFAATLKHGLIPNLLDAGRNPRYNARDATWFFTQILQEYANFVPNGISILDEKVKRRFPLDDEYITVDDERAFSHTSTIREILYEILARHAKGIEFREANAGPNLDSQMKDEGFNQKIFVDWENGLVFGGNAWNCGTWMDKMGESATAGNKGFPGTPRDGAAIEITGLLKSTLRWVVELNKAKLFDYTSVTTQDGKTVTLKEWNDKIQKSFEHAYYVPLDAKDDSKYDIDSHIVHRRGIYKDLYRSSNTYEDYQLRPNFAIAMTVAPELFDVEHGYQAIANADQIIRGPVGMATLDPADFNYRPYYNNSEDSTDFHTSKGRNYHQGPEWLWCTGFFLRAFLKFDLARKAQLGSKASGAVETFQQISRRLTGHRQWIRTSHWYGLTELTNKGGEFCHDSSPTQAWSTATLIDLFEDAHKAELELQQRA